MIFKQVGDILLQRKTMTRRAKKEHEYAYSQYGSDEITEVYTSTDERIRTKWRVGSIYAIVPKRGESTVLVTADRRVIQNELKQRLWTEAEHDAKRFKALYTDYGYFPLRIRITAIRQERLGDITHEDAVREGVESVEAYKALWVSINGKWDAEVSVWVISFEVVNNG